MAMLICTAMFMCNFLAAGPTISILETAIDFFPTAGPSGMADAIAKTAYFFTTTALLQGTGNIFWMPLVNKYGRRPIYLASFSLYLGTAFWLLLQRLMPASWPLVYSWGLLLVLLRPWPLCQLLTES